MYSLPYYMCVGIQDDKLCMDSSCGAQIRARAKWAEEGEGSTSYFLRLEQKHQSSNKINCLHMEGKSINNDKQILQEFNKFYSELFKSKRVNTHEILSVKIYAGLTHAKYIK